MLLGGALTFYLSDLGEGNHLAFCGFLACQETQFSFPGSLGGSKYT